MKHRKTFPAKRALRDEQGGAPVASVPATAPAPAPAPAPPLIVQAIGLQNAGRLAQAEALFRQILAQQPDDGPALYSLAVLLMGRPEAVDEALQVTGHGVAVAPAFAPLWLAHAGVLQLVDRKDEALAAYDRAIALKPDYSEALLNSGVLLREMHRHHDALMRFHQVLTFQPDHANALANCGILLTEFKQSEQAIAMFERLMQVKPDYDYLPGLLSYERLHACDWTDFGPLTHRILDGVRAGKRASKTLGLMAISDSASDHFLAARTFARHWFPQPREPLWRGERYAHDRLRIAYVSPDLREHPVGHLMAGIFERHDKTRFETYAFSLGIDDGSRLRQRMVAAFDHFFDVRRLGTKAIAALMREHEIDIAIDLAGYTSDSRPEVFAYRPAPVQAGFLGYPGTLGADFVDYLIADRHVLPEEHQRHYTEKVVYLPDSYLPTDASIEVADRTPTRAECGLPEGGPVLCSFSHDYKIHPTLFEAWMRILRRLPDSVLWLVSRNEVSHRNLRASAAAAGVDPARLVFATRVPRVEDHLARYRLADVFLDTSPYNAHTTAADALMAGLPVVTFMGGSFPSRVAGSLLHAIGLPELIADSLAGYEALVVELVSDRARLLQTKQRLAQNKTTHPLFDTDRFCRNLETLYAGLAPRTQIAVPADPPAEPPALQAELQSATDMLGAANLPMAELHLRRYQRAGGRNSAAAAMLDAVTAGYGLPPGFQIAEPSTPPETARYLLIKAWGFGFWSDVHHVLSQLLVAELTGRTPVVHWGRNTLFGDGSGADAFTHFFAPVSTASLATLQALPADTPVYPAKWTIPTLADEDVNKWNGPESRRAAQFFLARTEPLVVSDFYSTVHSLIPWIAPGSKYHGLGDDAIYALLYAKYLHPAPGVVAKVDAFARSRLAGRPWAAVHIRGSDKIQESVRLHETNARYFEFVDRIVKLNPQIGIFLMTDSVQLHALFAARYGSRLVATPALRSGTEAGVHLQGHEGRTVGVEVLVDALLAARCHYFVGNRESNVSLAVTSLKAWPPGSSVLLGEENCRGENPFLHRASVGQKQPPLPAVRHHCRLCGAGTQRQFEKVLMGRHRVAYHLCDVCKALQTDPPHWLDQAYAGKAERYDTGKASRTVINFLALPRLLDELGVRKSDVAVDFGGGTGLLARLMRDAGYNFHTCDKFGSSEFMGGYAWGHLDHPCRLVTLFEVAEHFADPAAEWTRIFACDPDWVLGSTGLYAGQGEDWSYLSPESGQQVFFYSHQALAHLAQQHGRQAYDLGLYFLITRTPLDAGQLQRVAAWRNDLGAACRSTFDDWSQAPYANASADNAEVAAYSRLAQSGKRIAIDGTFFRFGGGISRVWSALLARWSASDLAPGLLVIDRGRTAPRFPGLRYVDAPLYDYGQVEQDRDMLQALCDRENVGLFVSTYYTIPRTTPSALLVLDMIPEVMGFDLNDPQWQGKRRAIDYAQSYLSISESTERDLVRCYPATQQRPKAVTYCGCDFRTPAEAAVAAWKAKVGITRPYFMISGTGAAYKNTGLFFKAFERLGDARSQFAIVCTNANWPLEADAAACAGGAQVHRLVLDDQDLQCAYNGALALVYPSRYEGFGLPVLEAMACACPVVTCAVSSIPEVGGDAALYVGPDDVEGMWRALSAMQHQPTRLAMIERGRRQAARFSWTRMAREVGQSLAARAVTSPSI